MIAGSCRLIRRVGLFWEFPKLLFWGWIHFFSKNKHRWQKAQLNCKSFARKDITMATSASSQLLLLPSNTVNGKKKSKRQTHPYSSTWNMSKNTAQCDCTYTAGSITCHVQSNSPHQGICVTLTPLKGNSLCYWYVFDELIMYWNICRFHLKSSWIDTCCGRLLLCCEDNDTK